MITEQEIFKNIIYILTGRIKSGKTTFLFNRFNKKNGIAGILSITKNGKRILINIKTNEEKIFEVDVPFNGSMEKIGRFSFDEEAFRWTEKIIEDTDFSETEYFVIDEAGPLELNRKGFYKAIQNLLEKIKGFDTNIILVVREECVENIIELFKLENVKIVTQKSFNI